MALRQTGLDHLTLLSESPPDLVTIAAEAGFTAVGLRISPATDTERPWPMSPGSPMLAETRRRCAATGMAVLDVEAIRLGPRPADHRATLEVAAALGARYINAICEDPDLGRLSDSFAGLTARASGYGIRPLVEFMAYRSVRTLADAIAIAAASGGGGILIDALHVQRCGVSLASLSQADRGLFSYVQLCDAPLAAPADEIREARGGRLLPGQGELPLAALLAAVPGGIPVAVEAPAAGEMAAPGPYAARARAALETVLDQVKERS
ncbi:MAG TPA: TIM barrel protein [Trebonia sp.]|nr:TIM barrel protein [Trebonia sp.]